MTRQQLVVEGEMDQINGAVTLQFSQHVGTMDVYRLVAELELKGDLLDAVAFNQQIKDFAFTRVSTSSTCAGCSPPRSARSASAHR